MDITIEALHKRQEALAYALRVGRYARNQRAVPLLATAVDEAVAAARQLSVDEGWTEARVAARLDEIRGPADGLLREVRGALLDAAVAKWMAKVTNLCEAAMELAADAVLGDDNEYIALEIKEDIQKFGKQALQIEDAGMLGTLMHQVNLAPMFEKWPHSEWTRWW